MIVDTGQVIYNGLPKTQRYWSWATLMIGLTLAVIDGTLVNIALPTIAADFNAPPSHVIWVLNGYQLAIVISLLPMAALGEIYGYKRVYLYGTALFSLASIGCMYAPSIEFLTLARIIQGFGAAGLMSVSTALLRYTVPESQFGTAIGFNAVAVALSSSVGPSLAGAILAIADWTWLFVINLPLGITVVLLGIKYLPKTPRASRPFDYIGAVLTAFVIGMFITVISIAGNQKSVWSLSFEVLAILVALLLLIRRSLTMKEPMLPLDLLSIPVFALSICSSILSFTGQMMAFVATPFLFQSKLGFSPFETGLLIMPWPIALAIIAPLSGKLADSVSPAILGGVGLMLFATGLVSVGFIPQNPETWDIAWRLALCGAGFGLFQAPNNRLMIGSTPMERSGAASGMLGTARLLGQSFGAALIGFLLARWGIDQVSNFFFIAAFFAILGSGMSLARLKQPVTFG